MKWSNIRKKQCVWENVVNCCCWFSGIVEIFFFTLGFELLKFEDLVFEEMSQSSIK